MSKWEKVMDNRIGGAGSKAERVKQDRTFNRMMSFNKESDIAALKKEGSHLFNSHFFFTFFTFTNNFTFF